MSRFNVERCIDYDSDNEEPYWIVWDTYPRGIHAYVYDPAIIEVLAHQEADIKRMREALEEVSRAEKRLASTITTATKVQVLISAKALRLVRVALQPKEGK